jgi:hypothetical protein
MNIKKRLVVVSLILGFLSLNGGCAFYLDKSMANREYNILKPIEKKPLLIHVEYQVNGKPEACSNNQWTKMFIEAFNQSGMFSEVESADGKTGDTGQRIDITIDEEYDAFGTMFKGFITGFTFLVVGSNATAIDNCTVVYIPDGHTMSKKLTYSQLYHFSIGLIVARPEGDKQPSVAAGIKQMVKNFTVQTLSDLQKSGALQ